LSFSIAESATDIVYGSGSEAIGKMIMYVEVVCSLGDATPYLHARARRCPFNYAYS
jgi:hypothetical protein